MTCDSLFWYDQIIPHPPPRRSGIMEEVVFAQPGDLSLLGARTLEGFNAVVDARKKRLVAAGPIPAAPGSRAHPDRRIFASKLGRRVAAACPSRH
jgi:hypothetical protein